MWSTLAQLSLNAEELVVAERCFAALGNVAKATYLHKVNEDARVNGSQSYQVRARMAALNQHFKLAETIYLEQGAVDKVCIAAFCMQPRTLCVCCCLYGCLI